MLWVEAMSTVRARAEQGVTGPMRYRVRGLPREYDICIVKLRDASGWGIDRGDGRDIQGGFLTPADALRHLQGEFDDAAR
jgi:hypothetical protein